MSGWSSRPRAFLEHGLARVTRTAEATQVVACVRSALALCDLVIDRVRPHARLAVVAIGIARAPGLLEEDDGADLAPQRAVAAARRAQLRATEKSHAGLARLWKLRAGSRIATTYAPTSCE